uniref:Uncharacterized protein n=1 Tax=Anguilla anguilla TaxID=7936 RepID=A0A0E9XE60_ANGAN
MELGTRSTNRECQIVLFLQKSISFTFTSDHHSKQKAQQKCITHKHQSQN